MSSKLEIHTAVVDGLDSSSSVVGQMSGKGVSIAGVGAATTSGQTNTHHMTTFRANGRVYSLTQANIKSSFTAGDHVAFLCRHDKKSGEYTVYSFANLTSGSHRFYKMTQELRIGLTLVLVGIPLSLIVVGLVAEALGIPYLLWVLFTRPSFTKANKILSKLKGSNSLADAKAAVKPFDGKVVLEGFYDDDKDAA